ncbi:hypothetical protein TrVFT333_002471 [Trichoderma virens FT-333]|nr:hypothetical protein TrVFT333_002471 [Trichoderma virens FT-333]
MFPLTAAIVALALAAFPVAEAHPVAESTHDVVESIVEPRSSVVVEFWADNNYKGSSWAYSGDWNLCQNIPDYLNDKISSIKPQYTDGCVFYNDWYCSGYSFKSTSALSSLQSPFNDAISSFLCFPSGNSGNFLYG